MSKKGYFHFVPQTLLRQIIEPDDSVPQPCHDQEEKSGTGICQDGEAERNNCSKAGRYRYASLNSKSNLLPFSRKVMGTVLFADISGFTKLSTKLTSEKLKVHINDYFSKLLDIVYKHRGDVIKFCGDAVMILWSLDVCPHCDQVACTEECPVRHHNAAPGSEDASVFCASLCALELIKECGEYSVKLQNTLAHGSKDVTTNMPFPTVHVPAVGVNIYDVGDCERKPGGGNISDENSRQEIHTEEDYMLSLHCGIATGEIYCMCLGGNLNQDDKPKCSFEPEVLFRRNSVGVAGSGCRSNTAPPPRWEYLLSGEVLHEVGIATGNASSGEVCVSNAAYKSIGCIMECIPVTGTSSATPTQCPKEVSLCYKLTGNVCVTEVLRKELKLLVLEKSRKVRANRDAHPNHLSMLNKSDNNFHPFDMHGRIAGSASCSAESVESVVLTAVDEGRVRGDVSERHMGEDTVHSFTFTLTADMSALDERDEPDTLCESDASEGLNLYHQLDIETHIVEYYKWLIEPGECLENDSHAPPSSPVLACEDAAPVESPVLSSANKTDRMVSPTGRRSSAALMVDFFKQGLNRRGSAPELAPSSRRNSSTAPNSGSDALLQDNLSSPSKLLFFRRLSTPDVKPPSSNPCSYHSRSSVASSEFSVARRSSAPLASAIEVISPKSTLNPPPVSVVECVPDELSGVSTSASAASLFEHVQSKSVPSVVSIPILDLWLHKPSKIENVWMRNSQSPSPQHSLFPLVSHCLSKSYYLCPAVRSVLRIQSYDSFSVHDVGAKPEANLDEPVFVGAVKKIMLLRKIVCVLEGTKALTASVDTSESSENSQDSAETYPTTSSHVQSISSPGETCSSTLNIGGYGLVVIPSGPRLQRFSRCFIHEAALVAIENNNLPYLAEIRKIITVFIGIENLEDDFNCGNLARPLETYQIIAATVYYYGGSLRQFVVDDKGCVAIVSFGTPGACHENNIPRAIQCAITVQFSLRRNLDVSTRIGISHGTAFCGLVGSYYRCEYAMMGACVNLAARLMSACKQGSILMDETVFRGRIDIFGDASDVISTGTDGGDMCCGRYVTGAGCNSDSSNPSVGGCFSGASDGVPGQYGGTERPQHSEEHASIFCKGYQELVKVYSIEQCANLRSERCGAVPQPMAKGNRFSCPRPRKSLFVGRVHDLMVITKILLSGSGPDMLLVEGAAKYGKTAMMCQLLCNLEANVTLSTKIISLFISESSASQSLSVIKQVIVYFLMLKLREFSVSADGDCISLPEWVTKIRGTSSEKLWHHVKYLNSNRCKWLIAFAFARLVDGSVVLALIKSLGLTPEPAVKEGMVKPGSENRLRSYSRGARLRLKSLNAGVFEVDDGGTLTRASAIAYCSSNSAHTSGGDASRGSADIYCRQCAEITCTCLKSDGFTGVAMSTPTVFEVEHSELENMESKVVSASRDASVKLSGRPSRRRLSGVYYPSQYPTLVPTAEKAVYTVATDTNTNNIGDTDGERDDYLTNVVAELLGMRTTTSFSESWNKTQKIQILITLLKCLLVPHTNQSHMIVLIDNLHLCDGDSLYVLLELRKCLNSEGNIVRLQFLCFSNLVHSNPMTTIAVRGLDLQKLYQQRMFSIWKAECCARSSSLQELCAGGEEVDVRPPRQVWLLPPLSLEEVCEAIREIISCVGQSKGESIAISLSTSNVKTGVSEDNRPRNSNQYSSNRLRHLNSGVYRAESVRDGVVSLGKIVLSKSYGIPVYVQLYCAWVREQILSTMKRNVVETSSRKAVSIDLDMGSIPRGPEDLLLGKFDKLSDMHKMVLKVASVIGYVFDVNMLLEVMEKQEMYKFQQQLLASNTRSKQNVINTPSAVRVSFESLCAALERLEFGEWVTPDNASTVDDSLRCSGSGIVYKFCDQRTASVIYELMLNSQKELVHKYIYQYYESIYYNSLYRLLQMETAPSSILSSGLNSACDDNDVIDKTVDIVNRIRCNFENLTRHCQNSNNSAGNFFELVADSLMFYQFLFSQYYCFAESNQQRNESGNVFLSSSYCSAGALRNFEVLLDSVFNMPYETVLYSTLQWNGKSVHPICTYLSGLGNRKPAVDDYCYNHFEYCDPEGEECDGSCQGKRISPMWWLTSEGVYLMRDLPVLSSNCQKQPRILSSVKISRQCGEKKCKHPTETVLEEVEDGTNHRSGESSLFNWQLSSIMRSFLCIPCGSFEHNEVYAFSLENNENKPTKDDGSKLFDPNPHSKCTSFAKANGNVYALSCDVSYWVGEIGLYRIQNGDIAEGCELLFLAHKILLHNSFTSPLGSLQYSELYTAEYMLTRYLHFYQVLGWNYANNSTVYNLELAESVVLYALNCIRLKKESGNKKAGSVSGSSRTPPKRSPRNSTVVQKTSVLERMRLWLSRDNSNGADSMKLQPCGPAVGSVFDSNDIGRYAYYFDYLINTLELGFLSLLLSIKLKLIGAQSRFSNSKHKTAVLNKPKYTGYDRSTICDVYRSMKTKFVWFSSCEVLSINERLDKIKLFNLSVSETDSPVFLVHHGSYSHQRGPSAKKSAIALSNLVFYSMIKQIEASQLCYYLVACIQQSGANSLINCCGASQKQDLRGANNFWRIFDHLSFKSVKKRGVPCKLQNSALFFGLNYVDKCIEATLAAATTASNCTASCGTISGMFASVLPSPTVLIGVLKGYKARTDNILNRCFVLLEEYCEQEKLVMMEQISETVLPPVTDCNVDYEDSNNGIADTRVTCLLPGNMLSIVHYQKYWKSYLKTMHIYYSLLAKIVSVEQSEFIKFGFGKSNEKLKKLIEVDPKSKLVSYLENSVPYEVYIRERCDGIDMFSLKLPCFLLNASKESAEITLEFVAFYMLEYLLEIKESVGIYKLENKRLIASVENIFSIYFALFLGRYGKIVKENAEKIIDDAINIAESQWDLVGFFVTLYCLKLLIVFEKKSSLCASTSPSMNCEHLVKDSEMTPSEKRYIDISAHASCRSNSLGSNEKRIRNMFQIGCELLSNPPHFGRASTNNENFEECRQVLKEFLKV